MEWAIKNRVIILEVDLDTHSGEWLRFDLNSDDDQERQLNLSTSEDWEWLALEIENKQGQKGQ